MFIEADLGQKVAAFDRLMLGIEADTKLIATLRQRFIDEFPWNKNTTQIEQMVQDVLGTRPWGWGWHRLWRDRFEALGAFPVMWTTLSRVRPRALRETRTYDHRVFLLAHTLVHQGYRERLFSDEYSNCDMCWIGDPITDEPPAVIDLIIKLTKSYASGTTPADPPPFFPGDRTGFGTFRSEWSRDDDHSRLGTVCRLRPRF